MPRALRVKRFNLPARFESLPACAPRRYNRRVMNSRIIASSGRERALCKRIVISLTLTLWLAVCATAQSAGPRPATPAAMPMAERVRKELAEFKGKVSLFAKNLDTGASFGINEDNRVRTASTIKTAIMVEAF